MSARPEWKTLATSERYRLVKALCAAGLSASRIAARFDGATRNAVVGVIHRLKAKGEIVRLVGGQAKSQKRRERQPAGRAWSAMTAREKDEAVAAGRKEGLTCSQIAERHATKTWSVTGVLRRVKAGGHVDPARSTPTHAPHQRQASPSRTARPSTAAVIALPSAHGSRQTTSAMIDAWLAKDGGPRRFEAGATADLDALRRYVEPRGYTIGFSQKGRGTYTINGGRGRPKTVDRKGLFAFVDELRRADGLEPVLPPSPLPSERATA